MAKEGKEKNEGRKGRKEGEKERNGNEGMVYIPSYPPSVLPTFIHATERPSYPAFSQQQGPPASLPAAGRH
jgi:hypothetical protein